MICLPIFCPETASPIWNGRANLIPVKEMEIKGNCRIFSNTDNNCYCRNFSDCRTTGIKLITALYTKINTGSVKQRV
jgi:hypothetical protein